MGKDVEHYSVGPSVGNVLTVLRQLPAGGDVVLAGAHLLSPVDCVVGKEVIVEGEVVRFGGDQVYVGGRGVEAGMVLLSEFFSDLSLGDDQYLEVDADRPFSWLKPVKSGYFVHLFGAQELFTVPHLMVGGGISSEVLQEVVRLVFEGRVVAGGTVWTDGSGVSVRRLGDAWALEEVGR